MDYKKKYKQLHNFISDLYPFMSEYCKEKVEGFLPELKESDDEKIRKAIHIYLDWLDGRNKDYQPKGDYTIRDMIDWLVKQSEQSHWKPTEEQLQTIHAQLNEGAVTYPDDKRVLTTLYEDLMKITTQEEKKNWQKPADKIEPKFKVGDWVVHNDANVYQVKEIDYTNIIPRYELENIDGDKLSIPFTSDYDLRNWTIQDANNGDVLVYGGEIFMIKFYALWNKIVYHCCYDGKILHKHSIYDSWRKEDFDKVHPATKEQRKLLFSKMKEAGYEWDADKKELKNIDPCSDCTNDKGCINCENGNLKETEKSDWSEEDEKCLSFMIECLETCSMGKQITFLHSTALKYIDWLKSLKDRI